MLGNLRNGCVEGSFHITGMPFYYDYKLQRTQLSLRDAGAPWNSRHVGVR